MKTLFAVEQSSSRRGEGFSPLSPSRFKRVRGFTLVEIVVVLAIGAVVTAITVGAFASVSRGHKRTSCQTNLRQIYAAARLYAADEGGYFPFYDATRTAGNGRGIGLWALYTFSAGPAAPDSLPTAGHKPTERYVRSAKVLHCPSDVNTNQPAPANNNHEGLYTDGTQTQFNPDYLSYQTLDNVTPSSTATAGVRDRNTYQSKRFAPGANVERRSLLPVPASVGARDRPPAEDTVVTWCKWHGSGANSREPVLFYNGTVQLLPRVQTDPRPSTGNTTGNTASADLEYWRRRPEPDSE